MAKKVNTRFLIILTIIVVGGLIGLVVATQVLSGNRAKLALKRAVVNEERVLDLVKREGELLVEESALMAKLIAATQPADRDAAWKELETTKNKRDGVRGELASAWKDTEENLGKVLSSDPRNANTLLKIADARHELARFKTEPEAAWAAIKMWERVREVDPRNLQALNRLVDTYLEALDRSPNAKEYQDLRQRAAALAAVEPGNVKARACEHIGVLGAWLAGMATQPEDVIMALDSLEKLLAEKSEEWAIPRYVAEACFRLAESRQGTDAAGAADLRERARKAFEVARQNQPLTPGLVFHECMTVERLRYILYAGLQRLTEEQIETDRKERERLIELIRQVADPKFQQDRYYTSICIMHARALEQLGRREEADSQLIDLVSSRPYDVPARQRLGDVLADRPGEIQRAIDVLNAPIGDDPSLVGARARLRDQYEFGRLVKLVAARARYWQMAPPAERPAIKLTIERELAQAEGMMQTPTPELLVLKAKVLLLEPAGRNRFTAVQLMQQAIDLPNSRMAIDPETLLLLAANYRMVEQPGAAMPLLERALRIRPEAAPIRVEIVELLLQQREWEKARPHIDRLVKELENVTSEDARRWAVKEQVAALQIYLLIGTGKREQAMELIKPLPTANVAQRLFKSRLLQAAGDAAAAEAILKPMSDEELVAGAGEFQASQELAALLLRAGRKEDVTALAAKARQKNPGSVVWLQLEAQASDTRKEKLSEIREAALAQAGAGSPVHHALLAAQFKAEDGLPEEALNLLLAFDKTKPGDPLIIEAVFNRALALNNMAIAEQFAGKASSADIDRAGGAYFQARLKLARGDVQGAINDAQEMTRKVGELAYGWALLGKAQNQQGRFEDAIASYTKALEKQPDNEEVLTGLAECHLKAGQVALAQRYVDRGVNHPRPAAALMFREMARQLEELHGDPLKVTAEREKAAAANPESLPHRQALIKNYRRVAAVLKPTDEGRAGEYLRKAWATVTEAAAKWSADAGIAEVLDTMAIELGRPEEGLKVLERLAGDEGWKTRPEPLLLLARHYHRLAGAGGANAAEAIRTAEQFMLKALERSGDDVGMQARLAGFYLQTRNAERAVEVLKKLWGQTQKPEVRRELVSVLADSGRMEEAEKLLREGLATTPDDTQLLSLLAYTKLKQNKLDEGMATLMQVLKIDPRNAGALYYRGMIRQLSGDADGALADLLAARNQEPSNAEMRVAVANAYRKRGRVRDAIEELEQTLQSAPARADARVLLAELYFADRRWLPAERLLADARSMPEFATDSTWAYLESRMWVMRDDLGKAFASIRAALQANPQHTESQYMYLDILRMAGKFDDIVTLTEGASKQPAPLVAWQVHVARGYALKQIPARVAQAEAAFDAGLSSIDARNADEGTQHLIKAMVVTMGSEWTIKRLDARLHPRWRIQLAELYAGAGQLNKAGEVADSLMAELANVPEHLKLSALKTAGMIYTLSAPTVAGTGDKAVKAYADYLDVAERRRLDLTVRLEAMNNLAYLLAEHLPNPNPERALSYSRRAYDLMQQGSLTMPELVDTHGWVLVLAGKLDEGITVLSQAATAEGAIPDTFYHLGQAYVQKKAYDLAETNLNRAREVYNQRKAAKLPVDPSLEGRIQAALTKVGQLRAAAATGDTAP